MQKKLLLNTRKEKRRRKKSRRREGEGRRRKRNSSHMRRPFRRAEAEGGGGLSREETLKLCLNLGEEQRKGAELPGRPSSVQGAGRGWCGLLNRFFLLEASN